MENTVGMNSTTLLTSIQCLQIKYLVKKKLIWDYISMSSAN